jgi:hypothetical protein
MQTRQRYDDEARASENELLEAGPATRDKFVRDVRSLSLFTRFFIVVCNNDFFFSLISVLVVVHLLCDYAGSYSLSPLCRHVCP